jgi:hypothetical protein
MNVKSLCAELAANLKAQGWTKEGSDLVTPASSILKRKRGDAALTIFVKPESTGSEVKIFTEGPLLGRTVSPVGFFGRKGQGQVAARTFDNCENAAHSLRSTKLSQ